MFHVRAAQRSRSAGRIKFPDVLFVSVSSTITAPAHTWRVRMPSVSIKAKFQSLAAKHHSRSSVDEMVAVLLRGIVIAAPFALSRMGVITAVGG